MNLEYEIEIESDLPLSGLRLYIEEIKEVEEGLLLSEIYEDTHYIDLDNRGIDKGHKKWVEQNSVSDTYVILKEDVDYTEWEGELGDIIIVPSKLPEKLLITCVLSPINNLPKLYKSYSDLKGGKRFSVYNDPQILRMKFTVYTDEVKNISYSPSVADEVEYEIRERIQKGKRKYVTNWD